MGSLFRGVSTLVSVITALALALTPALTAPVHGAAQSPEPPRSITDDEKDKRDADVSDPYLAERQRMVEKDIKARGVKDPEVLRAMLAVPRHLFVAAEYLYDAYADHPLPIGEGQTISQPYVVAFMTELLRLSPGDRVLEIGTGSGYQAAVLAEITDEVYTIEIRKGLAGKAKRLLASLDYNKVETKMADGYYGWSEHGPFDAIIVTAAANHVPTELLKQLSEGGRLVIPLGATTFYQTLTRITRTRGEFEVEQLMGVRFVPLVGGTAD